MPSHLIMHACPALPATAPQNDADPTMLISSVDVAERVGKAHSHVLRDIRRIVADLEKAGQISQSKFGLASYRDDQGKIRPCFDLSKSGLLILASGYSAVMRAALIDRLDELERAAAAPAAPTIPTTYTEALRAALINAEEADRQRALADDRQRTIEAQAPAVAMVATFSSDATDRSIQAVARDLRILPLNKLFTVLEAKRWIFRKPSTRKGPGRWQATAEAIRRGLLKHDVYHVAKPGGGTDESLSVVVTAKGQALIQESLVNVQLDLMVDVEGKASDAA